jgi:hypothetical protein
MFVNKKIRKKYELNHYKILKSQLSKSNGFRSKKVVKMQMFIKKIDLQNRLLETKEWPKFKRGIRSYNGKIDKQYFNQF